MYSSLSRQTWGVCLLGLIVALVSSESQSAVLKNVSITSAGENSISLLSGDIGSAGGGEMTLRVDWGDGTVPDVYSYTNTATNFLIGHFYEDDNPTGTAGDLYSVSVALTNNTGGAFTNMAVVITNVPPRLALNANSPIEIGAPTTLQGLEITEFPVPTEGSSPQGMTVGPDGNLWFTETSANRIGRLTTNGVITEFPIGGGARSPLGIATGADNRLWFCLFSTGQIGAMATNGAVSLYTIPRAINEPLKSPQYIARRGAHMWYTDLSYRIGRITTAGVVMTQYVHQAGVNPWGIAVDNNSDIWFGAFFTDTVNRLRISDGVTTSFNLAPFASPALMTKGPDGAIWFTENQGGNIGRITTSGVLTTNFVGFNGPYGICAGPEGAIWFTEHRRATNSVARLTLDGRLSRYPLAIFSDVNEIITGPDGALWFTMPGRNRIGRIRYTAAGNVLLSAALNDPGNLDPHTVQIDWGDGTPAQTLDLAPGIASFHVAHTYSGSQPAYLINVTATDDDTGVSQVSTLVVVNSIQLRAVTRSPSGEVRVRGVGANGKTITMESSSDLLNWSPAGTVNSVSNAFEFVHPNAPGSRRFYRGRVP